MTPPRIAFAWDGVFATTPDGLPYIGGHPDYPRQLFALGYGGMISFGHAAFVGTGAYIASICIAEGVTSAWIGSTTATNTISGTSMASPHAAGVGALYKQVYGDAASSTIVTWIINASTPNLITGNPAGTPNRLLYKGTM